MQILIVASSLGMGGAERAAVNAARILSVHHDVRILIFHRRIDYHPNTPVDCLDIAYNIDAPLHRKVGRFVTKISGLRASIAAHRAELVMSFGDSASLICLANKVGTGGPLVVTNTQAPPTKVYQGAIRPLYLNLIRAFYPHADRSIALSSGVRQELISEFGLGVEPTAVIYNALDLDEIAGLEDQGSDDLTRQMERGPCVLNVGRLTPQKNQALLIRAFRRVRDRVVARLIIAGTGPLEPELRAQAKSLGLEQDVVFAGWQPNPFRLMKRAGVFALSSDYEGFGNVLTEAMAVGCPVVSTDCDFGPAEILRESGCGSLVPVGDEAALAAAISRVLEDAEHRRSLSQKGRLRAQDFSLQSVGRAYQELLDSLRPPEKDSRQPHGSYAACSP